MSRNIIPINQGWFFNEYPESTSAPFVLEGEEVQLPHTWNKVSDKTYHRGRCLYTKKLKIDETFKEKIVYLEFLGVNVVCTVYLNNQYVGSHRGGYATFRFDITEFYQWEEENVLAVIVDNGETEDVSPLMGDFTIFGGIYREVNILAVPKTHFDPLYYGTQGIQLLTEVSGQKDGVLTIWPLIRGTGAKSITYQLYSPTQELVAEKVVLATETSTKMEIPEVSLWDGKENPLVYRFRAELNSENEEKDSVELTCGFRYFEMTADQGMILNGKRIPLYGVGIHQDKEGLGNAVEREDKEKDFKLIEEMGANMIRLTHYQHAPHVYDICDREGYVVWTEIPMLAMTENPKLLENAKEQLKELILQNCHHPSVFFWGIQNEIAMFGENQYMYDATEELNQLAKQLDPTRVTACANLHNVTSESYMNQITDIVGYNLYYGWYYGEMEEYQDFFDDFHKKNPNIPLGISEYGVDCNLNFHTDTPKRKDYTEEFQCLFHEKVYGILERNPWIWGCVIWNMFDFGSAIRDEGGTKGKNAKGLITYDRSIKKDAFYYYKACWGNEPMLHLTGRRYAKRAQETTSIKVYSNQKNIALYVNGECIEKKSGDRVFIFENIPLIKGENAIKVVSGALFDEITLERVLEPVEEYVYIDPNPGFNVKNWFLESSDEVSTDKTYSLWDTVGELKENEKAWSILQNNLPQLWQDPTFEKRNKYVLFKLINRASSRFEESAVKLTNEELMKIPKEGGNH